MLIRLLLVFLFVIQSACAADFIGRMADSDPTKGGDPRLKGLDTFVSPQGNPPGDVSAPDVTSAGEASADRSQLPDDPAPQPFITSRYVHKLQVGNHIGSCVYLGNGLFITCAHIFANNPEVVIKIDDKQYGGKRTALWDIDLAYLEMNKIPEDWPASKVAVRKIDFPVILYGMKTQEHKGSVSEWKPSGKEIFIDTPGTEGVAGGDSGGGVFTEDGELVAIITLKVTGYSRAGVVPLYLAGDKLPIQHLLPEKDKAPVPPKEGRGLTFLLFSADWCGPCAPAKKVTKPELEKRTGVKVIIKNSDSEQALVRRYNIEYLPTWVLVDDSEKELGRSVNGSVDSLVDLYNKNK